MITIDQLTLDPKLLMIISVAIGVLAILVIASLLWEQWKNWEP